MKWILNIKLFFTDGSEKEETLHITCSRFNEDNDSIYSKLNIIMKPLEFKN